MDRENASKFIENFIARLEFDGSKYLLHGGVVTATEVDALRCLIGLKDSNQADFEEQSNAPTPSFDLNDSCLSADCNDGEFSCIDFGTAFSKVAYWNHDEADPIPLAIGEGLSADPLLIDSVVFVGDEKIYFGPKAIEEYEKAADPERQLFDSPKEVLTLDFESLQYDRPNKERDPHKRFKKKDLLVLFLGFLTSLTGRELGRLGKSALVKRRFATPGWGDAQDRAGNQEYQDITTQMRRFLAEAQILADSISEDDWLNGVPLVLALSALDALAKVKDETLASAAFVERPVLEAAASASSMKEELLNQRPQVLVIDVGAGTTDIGVFKYVGSDAEPKFAAYVKGFAALKIAGKRLDDAFKSLVRTKLEIDISSTAGASLERHLARNIHGYKKRLFEQGSVKVEVEGLPEVAVTADEFMETQTVRNFRAKFEEKISQLLEIADDAGGRSFTATGSDNVVVFTGGGGTLPFLREVFDSGVKVGNQKAFFERIEPRPSWLEDASEAVNLVFPQISVSVGGASPDLPREFPTVGDTSRAAPRSLPASYKGT